MSIDSAVQSVAEMNAALTGGTPVPSTPAPAPAAGDTSAGAPSPAASEGAPAAASFAAALSEATLAMLAEGELAAFAPGATGAGGAGAGIPGMGDAGAGGASALMEALAMSSASGLLGGGGLAGISAPGIGTLTSGASPLSSLGVPGTLPGAGAVAGASTLGAPGAGPIGQRIAQIAESQAGRHEEPMGSNEGEAVAMYRTATRGAMPGEPWCAYFASWVARQAGEPLGAEGQGLGSVGQIWEWAQSTGRAIPNGPGVVPQPGDLIVFGGEHVGIVRGVLPDGQIETVEGNYENKVALNTRSPSEPTGYVRMG